MHLRGWADEATAQCYGLQEVAFTVERLGGSLSEGVAVANYMLSLQPFLPRITSRASARPARSLDLHPETEAVPGRATSRSAARPASSARSLT